MVAAPSTGGGGRIDDSTARAPVRVDNTAVLAEEISRTSVIKDRRGREVEDISEHVKGSASRTGDRGCMTIGTQAEAAFNASKANKRGRLILGYKPECKKLQKRLFRLLDHH